MHTDVSPRRARRGRLRAAVPFLCIVASAGGSQAEPLRFDLIEYQRAGSLLPEVQPAASASLRPSLELPGGKVWLKGEVPSGEVDPRAAIHAANASVGVRLPVSVLPGIGLETKPTLIGSAAAAEHPGVSSLSPGIGFSVAQAVTVQLPIGVRLGAEGAVGDRLGIYGVGAASTTTAAPPLAMRARATLSTSISLPFTESRFQVGLGIATTGGLMLAGGWDNRAYTPSDCALSLDFGRIGGAALHVTAPCSNSGLSVTPISFGFKTTF